MEVTGTIDIVLQQSGQQQGQPVPFELYSSKLHVPTVLQQLQLHTLEWPQGVVLGYDHNDGLFLRTFQADSEIVVCGGAIGSLMHCGTPTGDNSRAERLKPLMKEAVQEALEEHARNSTGSNSQPLSQVGSGAAASYYAS